MKGCRKQEGMFLLAPNPTWRKRLWRTKHNDFTIKLSPQTKKGDPPPPHPTVSDGPVQTKGKATSLHEQLQQQLPISLSPEGLRIMSPPVNYPHAFSTFHWMHTGAVTLNQSEGVKNKEFWANTVIECLKTSLIKGWEWEINQKFKS